MYWRPRRARSSTRHCSLRPRRSPRSTSPPWGCPTPAHERLSGHAAVPQLGLASHSEHVSGMLGSLTAVGNISVTPGARTATRPPARSLTGGHDVDKRHLREHGAEEVRPHVDHGAHQQAACRAPLGLRLFATASARRAGQAHRRCGRRSRAAPRWCGPRRSERAPVTCSAQATRMLVGG
jgi:hypothetical protein